MQCLERDSCSDSWGSNKPRVHEIKSTGGDAEESLQATLLKLAKKKKQRMKVIQIIKESGPRILTDCDTDLLLRWSRKYRNPELFAFILKSKPKTDVQVPNLSPLITAALEEDWPAARNLHNALVDDVGAQFRKCGKKWKRAPDLEIHKIEIEEKNWSESVIASRLVSKMLDRGLKIEQVARTLHELYCALRLIVHFGNAELTKAFLACNQPLFFIDYPALRMLVRNVDVAQLEVFLDYNATAANPWHFAEELFCLMINDMSRLHEYPVVRSFARSLLRRREFFNDKFFAGFESAIMRASKENLEMFFEYEFRSMWMLKYKVDILASAFGNRDPDVLQLLKYKVTDVETRGSKGRTPLEFAATGSAAESVRFLLGRGADPNARNERGRRPLHCAYKLHEGDTVRIEECVRLLLIGGADPLLVYQDKPRYRPFFGIYGPHLRPEGRRIVEYLVAELAVREALGRSVEMPMGDCRDVMGKECTDNFYEGCRRQIDELKSHRIRDNLTMFGLLSEREGRTVRISEDDRCAIASFMRSYEVNKRMMPYYCDVLKKRIKMIDRMKIYIDTTKGILSEVMQLDSDHLVIHQILKYLTFRDVLILE